MRLLGRDGSRNVLPLIRRPRDPKTIATVTAKLTQAAKINAAAWFGPANHAPSKTRARQFTKLAIVGSGVRLQSSDWRRDLFRGRGLRDIPQMGTAG
jgi:hypothetical protein